MYFLCLIGLVCGCLMFGGVIVSILMELININIFSYIGQILTPLGSAILLTACLVVGLIRIVYCGAIVDPEEGKYH